MGQSNIEGDVATGTASGHIYIWSCKGQITASVTAHESSIYVIITTKYGIITGGKDGLLKIWSNNWQILHVYDTKTFTQSLYSYSACNSITLNINSSKLAGNFFFIKILLWIYLLFVSLIVGLNGGNVYGNSRISQISKCLTLY